jgi:dTDP-4-dehydrorhamnose reductase
MKVLVTGAAGHLGDEMVKVFSRAHEVVPFTRAALDVTNAAAVMSVVQSTRPDAVINCAAYNDVDGAEDNPVTAFQVNAFAPQALARAAASAEAALVHFSTDFVFDGETDRPYTEGDRPGPRGVYAASKLVGEWLAREAPRHYVLRVESLFGGSSGQPLRSVGKIVESVQLGREVPVFVDRVVSPTSVTDASLATMAILERDFEPGVYHCVNSGSCRWDELATEVGRLLQRAPKLKPITLKSVALKAQRPRYCALSNQKLADAGIRMSHWRDALRTYVADHANT